MSAPTRAPRRGLAYGEVEAVRGVSLSLQPGSIVTVIGANGAGKTTLLTALMAPPAAGDVTFDGTAIDGDASRARGAGHRMVPERRECSPI